MQCQPLQLREQFQQCQPFFEITIHFLRSQNNHETWNLDTLLGLKDLEIAQVAHHLRPIFGLVLFGTPPKYFVLSPLKLSWGDRTGVVVVVVFVVVVFVVIIVVVVVVVFVTIIVVVFVVFVVWAWDEAKMLKIKMKTVFIVQVCLGQWM